MKIKSMTMAAAAAMLGLASCSSEETLNGDQSTLFTGDQTYTAFTISMANSGTRVTQDENAVEVEQTIASAHIYIFAGGVLEVKATPTINNNVTQPIKVTTGEKLVYVVTSDKVGTALDGKANVAGTTVEDFEKEAFEALATDIAVSGNFSMIGSTRATVLKWNQQQAVQAENLIKVTVDRAAAKVQVKYTKEGEGAVTVAEHLNANFSDAQFTLGQQSRQMYVKLGSRFTNLGDAVANTGTYAGLVPVPTSGDLGFINAPASYDKDYDKNKYTAENVVEKPTTGNVTFAIVKVKATPKNVYQNKALNGGSFWVLARNDASTATWVFASDADYNVLYFADETDANNYKNTNNLASTYTATEYSGGEAYYRVNIKDNTAEGATLSDKYRVVRNNCYRINVTDIKGLGAPTAPGVVPTDPETPIEQDNYMAAEIDLTPWTMHEQSESLQ